ncbi:Kunitz/Bovine pancreatic trypsin inhibitor domain protein [Necator americanus]|uniref:Kunitz/Bovine pancreatic trypsin inhibitor domain protein n=1 Tax=Necator americanus TaxID=51031 RepID=W2SYN9_NECAM|nr:Kunitz/Bovine pancreatic trypsin inhibitor domain protein [Necator americanus]ETN74051.1 Kunitz/Bovine pancreatic trypsin inhibitor domain protein [Necator americanus]
MNADQGDGNCSEKIYIGVRPVFSNDNRENGVKIQKLELGEAFEEGSSCRDAPVSELCGAPMNIGVTCNDAHLTAPERYYYDPKTSTCRRFFYQGCGGNANNFQDEAKCVAVCETAVVATLSRETTIFTHWKCPAGYRNVDSICIQRIFDYNNELSCE